MTRVEGIFERNDGMTILEYEIGDNSQRVGGRGGVSSGQR